MPNNKEIKANFDILDELYDENYDYLQILIAYKRMLKNQKKPDYTIEEYEYLFKTFYEDYKNKKYKNIENVKEIIGGYGELLFYRKLCKNPDLEVTWVSRYHGDKYGFDFVTYDEVLKQFIFYEVKTTINQNKIGEFYITENEYKKYDRLSGISILCENVRFIIANILIDDKNIIDEFDYCINSNITEMIEFGKSVSVTNKNKTISYERDIIMKRLLKRIK